MKKKILYLFLFFCFACKSAKSSDLIDAVRSSEISKVEQELKKTRDNINQVDEFEWSALTYAVHQNKYAIAKLLLENGASTECASERFDKWTPIFWAAYLGYANLVRLLLSFSARTDVFDSFGCTPLMKAASRGYYKIVEELLLDKNVDVFATDKNNKMAIDYAASAKIRKLIKRTMVIHASSLHGLPENQDYPDDRRFNPKNVFTHILERDSSFLPV